MRRIVIGLGTLALVASVGTLNAQDHSHLGPASGVPHGIPRICADATVTAVASGAWSNPSTWSTQQVPGSGAAVRVGSGIRVGYDVVSDVALRCVDVEGELIFRTNADTRRKVSTLPG